jgi:hypothetical protein
MSTSDIQFPHIESLQDERDRPGERPGSVLRAPRGDRAGQRHERLSCFPSSSNQA